MNQAKFSRLVMVTGDNNNKYYELTWDGASPTFEVKYGRIKSTATTHTYGIHEWDSKYNSKVKKGYKDVTHTVAVTVEEKKEESPKKLKAIEDSKVEAFLTLMKKYTDGLVSKTYTVKHQDVTVQQIDEAQKIIDDLNKIDKNDVTLFNTRLLELYMIIPRYMSNVKSHLIPNIDVASTLQQEQDNLDAMASQVKMYKKEEVKKSDSKKKTEVDEPKSLLDLLGIKKMKQISGNKEIHSLTNQITGKRVEAIFEVEKPWEDERLNKWLETQENKKTMLVYHGTKCPSVIPILEQGLKVRPVGNFQFTGKVYGNGNYFSEQFSTSIGYTGGGHGDAVMLIYEIHTGKEASQSFNNYNDCKKAGYDSFNGGWLRVAYREEQARIKYIVWLK